MSYVAQVIDEQLNSLDAARAQRSAAKLKVVNSVPAVAVPAVAQAKSPPVRDKASGERRLSAEQERQCKGLVRWCRNLPETCSDEKAIEMLRARIAKAFPPELADVAFNRVLKEDNQ
jgi:hypothetical protein